MKVAVKVDDNFKEEIETIVRKKIDDQFNELGKNYLTL